MRTLSRRTMLVGLTTAAMATALAPSFAAVPVDQEAAPKATRYRAVPHRQRYLVPVMPNAESTPRTVLDVGAELGLNFSEDRWQFSVADLTNDAEYAPWQALLRVAPQAKVARPDGAEWDFLGTQAGKPVWVLPQFQEAGLLYLAISNEDTVPGTFASYDPATESGGRVNGSASWVRVRLLYVEGPGKFSTWSSDELGQTIVWMSNANGINANDSVWIREAEDIHINFGFTKPGRYNIVLQASAFKPGQNKPRYSRPVVYRFNVEP